MATRQEAEDLAALLMRALKPGASLKSLTHNNRQAHAVISSVLSKRKLLDQALEMAEVRVDTGSADLYAMQMLLAHEVLYGRGLRRIGASSGGGKSGGASSAKVDEALHKLRLWQRDLIKEAKKHPSELNTASAQGTSAADASIRLPTARQLPRYVRVNTLKVSVADAVSDLEKAGWRHVAPQAHRPPHPGELWVDPLVPELLVLPAGCEMHQHVGVQNAVLILQDKASCLSPAALDPPIGALVVDATAAPGNKSTMLAARCHDPATGVGKVIACERDSRRAKTLEQRAALAAGDAVQVVQGDFLELDPTTKPFCDATHILLDPSCSGSGMVNQGAPEEREEQEPLSAAEGGPGDAGVSRPGDTPRLRALAAMQLKLLCHALSFPKVKTVVYSTCSVHPIEDETVVSAALKRKEVQERQWRVAPALPNWKMRGLPIVPFAQHLVRAGPEVMTNGFFVARLERD